MANTRICAVIALWIIGLSNTFSQEDVERRREIFGEPAASAEAQFYKVYRDPMKKVILRYYWIGEKHAGIRAAAEGFLTMTYNEFGNVEYIYDFDIHGALKRFTEHRYDSNGKWIEGRVFDANMSRVGTELTPPQAYLYDKRRALPKE